jgi:cellulose biosynthesis protein BcsQ
LETPVNNLDLVPADIRLARFEMQPDYLTHRMKNQLAEIDGGYDLVFLDCPPQLGKLFNSRALCRRLCSCSLRRRRDGFARA